MKERRSLDSNMTILYTRISCALAISYDVSINRGIKKIISSKIATLLKTIDSLKSKDNTSVIMDFYDCMWEEELFEDHIINNSKALIGFVNYLNETRLYDVDDRLDSTSTI